MTDLLATLVYLGGVAATYRKERKDGERRGTALGTAISWPIDFGAALVLWMVKR